MQPISPNAYHALLKGRGKPKKGVAATTIQDKSKKSLETKLARKSKLNSGKVEITLPIRTVSEGNCFEHWQKKHARHKQQHRIVSLALNPIKCQIKLPCHIRLTRYAPRQLDKHDNLPMSMKYLVDKICAVITGDNRSGHADSDDRITISYDQEKSKDYSVKILISF